MLAIPLCIMPWVLACAGSGPPPQDAWAVAQADIGRAQAGGAPDVPEAKLHLQLATEDLQRSREAMGSDNERAKTLSALASVEARLALSLAKSAAALDAARKYEDDLQKATSH
jgi:hypothetical protein